MNNEPTWENATLLGTKYVRLGVIMIVSVRLVAFKAPAKDDAPTVAAVKVILVGIVKTVSIT